MLFVSFMVNCCVAVNGYTKKNKKPTQKVCTKSLLLESGVGFIMLA